MFIICIFVFYFLFLLKRFDITVINIIKGLIKKIESIKIKNVKEKEKNECSDDN